MYIFTYLRAYMFIYTYIRRWPKNPTLKIKLADRVFALVANVERIVLAHPKHLHGHKIVL